MTARPKAKPKHLYLLLMAGCNIGHKRQADGTKVFSVIQVSSYYTDVCSSVQLGSLILDILSITTEQYEEVLDFFSSFFISVNKAHSNSTKNEH